MLPKNSNLASHLNQRLLIGCNLILKQPVIRSATAALTGVVVPAGQSIAMFVWGVNSSAGFVERFFPPAPLQPGGVCYAPPGGTLLVSGTGFNSNDGSFSGGARMLRMVLVSTVVAPPPPPPPQSALSLQHIEASVDPLALCNDGTTAAYYWRAAQTPSLSKTWVVYLEGGGWCSSYLYAASCAQRQKNSPDLFSSSGYAPTNVSSAYPLPAIADPGLSRLAGANVAWVKYCSSDLWSADQAGPTAGSSLLNAGWQFRGRRIVKAALASLQLRGFAVGAGHSLLLAGGSAGAVGAMANIDSVAAAYPAVSVKGFFDSPLMLDGENVRTARTTAPRAPPAPRREARAARAARNAGLGGTRATLCPQHQLSNRCTSPTASRQRS